MPLHDKAFWILAWYLIGVAIASATINFSHSLLISAILSVFPALALISSKKELAVLSLAAIVGVGHFELSDALRETVLLPENQIPFTAIIKKSEERGESQRLTVELNKPFSGKIRITADRFPKFSYGDTIEISGNIETPTEENQNYLRKDNLSATALFPEISLIKTAEGFSIRRTLYNIKDWSDKIIKKTLPQEEAVFMSGILLGETGSFKPELRDALSSTGTSHLVALSGYNITIVAESVMIALGWFLKRKKAFAGGAIAITLFVIMTGAEAATVRAGIMGLILLLANQSERIYSFRNAITISAAVMVMINPNILFWDIGFQLSFVAVLGLIYLRPVISKFLKFESDKGFLNWKENIATTIAAQIAVLPILLNAFGSFSPVSILANMLVLSAIPLTMLFGVFVIFMGSILSFLGFLFGYVAHFLLLYELTVIKTLSRFSMGIHIEHINIIAVIFYYVIVLYAIRSAKVKNFRPI